MYCPSCGTEVTRELNYCNRCGANLNLAANVVEQPARQVSVKGSFWPMALMVVIGLGIIFAGVNDLAKKDVHPAAITWIAIASLAMLFGVVSLFLRQLSHMSGAQQQERPAKRKKTDKDDYKTPAQLPPTRIDPVPSVTENTTRTFEPIERRK